jgi:hypothetical protein
LVGKVISFLAGDSNEKLSDKEMLLRQTQKDLTQNRFAKFYRAKTDEADPVLAVFFHSIYKAIYPVRVFMKDTAKMTRLRQVVLEAFMDASITELTKRLNPEVIWEQAKTKAPAEITAQIQDDINKLSASFNADRIIGVNNSYNLVMSLFQLVTFDYPGLLKKFDPTFADAPFSGEPKFSPVKSALVAKEIGDFLIISRAVNSGGDWKILLGLLKACAGQELIPADQLSQTLFGLREVCSSKVLELIVQMGIRNPIWQYKARTPDEHIGEAWLETRIAAAQQCLKKINTAQRNNHISALSKEVFDTVDITRLENYTTAKGKILRDKELEEYAYIEGLSSLRFFLGDFMGREIHEICDLLLIRGQWTNNTAAREMSDALHSLLEVPASITKFDETLSEDGSDGSRLKAALLRVDRDHTQIRYINSIVSNCNNEALELLTIATQHLSLIGKNLKDLLDDVQKKHPELLINWRELHQVSKDPLVQRITYDHKKISTFVQLLQLCAQ